MYTYAYIDIQNEKKENDQIFLKKISKNLKNMLLFFFLIQSLIVGVSHL